jgi:hypothetical protein
VRRLASTATAELAAGDAVGAGDGVADGDGVAGTFAHPATAITSRAMATATLT